ncbi:MAG: hypothetical protein Q7S58_11745 [Candidatus Binatus sp.]|uniref:hypothetical protein n=1 Tax=Candidatus Binatus sp. TaxID=2811406 RepID=UPI00271DDCCF|nr:hypothetical protein [Candidatus Binatus sp.]MDO8433071.1 hypothetical protein [Candidatus Binatus sp.]
MTTVAYILGLTSGFGLMGYAESPANLIATSIIVDLALAPLTAIVAIRRNRSITAWAIAGFALGAWALACVMILPAYRPAPPRPPQYPPTSDAA